MRRRRGIFLQKAMAVLLSVLLCLGLIVSAGPVDAWAEEGTQTAYLIVEFDGSTEVPTVKMDVYLKDDNNNVYHPSSSSKAGSLTYKVENLLPNKQYYWIIDGTTIPFKDGSSEFTVVRTLYSVKFMDGSNVLYTQYVAYGGKAQRPSSNPTKPDYTFVRWRNIYGTEYRFDTSIIENSTTIYSEWRRTLTNDALSQQLQSALSQITITNKTGETDIIDNVKERIKQVFDIEPTVTANLKNRKNATITSEGSVELEVSVKYGDCTATEVKSISTPKEGVDWTLSSTGYLTISSQTGMNDWVNNGGRTNNLSNVQYIYIGYNVTEIPDNAFDGCSNLRTVSYIPYTVKNIGKSAFAGASSLSTITLPSNLQSVGEGAFSGCSSLRKVKMSGNTPPTFMGDSIFDNCKFVTKPANGEGIVVPSGRGKEYKEAVGLKFAQFVIEEAPPKLEVTESALSEKLQEILNGLSVSNDTTMDTAMRDVKKQLDDYFLNKSTIQAGYYALTRATYENDGLIVLEMTAFCSRYSVTKQVTKSVPKLTLVLEEDWTLDEDGNLIISGQMGMDGWMQNGRTKEDLSTVKNVLIWGNVTEIPENAFSGCGNLGSVSIPDTVTDIRKSAFAGALSLGEVSLPANLQSIGDGAFSGCSSLERVIMQGTTPPEVLDTAFNECKFVEDKIKGINVPKGYVETYKSELGVYGEYVAEELLTVTEEMLRNELETIFTDLPVSNATTVDDIVRGIKTEIDKYFGVEITVQADNFSIKEATDESDGSIYVDLKVSYGDIYVQTVKEKRILKLSTEQDRGWTLDGEGNLKITSQAGMDDWIQNGRTEENLQAVKNVLILDGVTTIPGNAFKDCVDIRTGTISGSVQAIGNGAFSGCSSLEKVVMQGSTPPTIGDSVFEGCKFVTGSVGGIVVPSGTAEEYNRVFGGTWGTYVTDGSLKVTDAALKSKLQEILVNLPVSNDITQETVKNIVKGEIDEYFKINSVIMIAEFNIIKATHERDGSLELAITASYGESPVRVEAAIQTSIPIARLILPDRGWTLDEAGNLVISSQAGMDDWTLNGRAEGKFPAVKNVSIKSGVTGIPEDAFSGCGELKAVDIPDTVTSIGSQAFKHAYSLSEVTLPQNLQSIGDGAFSDCSSLEKVVMQGTTPPSIGASVFEQCKFVTDSSKGIVVPKGSEDTYKAAWGAMGDNILEKHTHNYDDAEWSNDENSHWKECSSCGVPGDKAAHEWGEGIVTKEPTETEPGVMSYYCSVCGREKTQTIPATGGNGNQDGTGEGTPAVPDNNQGGDDSGNGPGSGNDAPGGSGDISVSGNDNPGGSESVSGNDNPGDGDIPVPGNDNPGDGDIPAPGNENPGGGDSPSVPENSNQSSRSGGDESQQPEVNSSDLTLLWNTLTASAPKDAEPRTADGVPLELYATVAMIAGFFYLLLLFLDKYDITEEKRRESLGRLVKWAKCGGWPRKLPVMAVLLLMRTYYRIVGDQRSKEKKI